MPELLRQKLPSASGIEGNSISDRILDQMRMAGRPRTTTTTTEQPEEGILGSIMNILMLVLANNLASAKAGAATVATGGATAGAGAGASGATASAPIAMGENTWLGTTPITAARQTNPIMNMMLPSFQGNQPQAKTVDQMTPSELLEALLGRL